MSTKNTVMKRREPLTLLEKLYVIEIAKGVSFTFGTFLKNFFRGTLRFIGFKSIPKHNTTVYYPEEKREYPARYRGRHRLTLKDDGSIKCTSCFLCATACPAKCIYIEAQETEDKSVEKFPHRYEIDTLLCIYCGYCVEACPVDAIRMDSGVHPEVYGTDPKQFIEDKEVLMARSKLVDKGDNLLDMHLEKMQQIEKIELNLKKKK